MVIVRVEVVYKYEKEKGRIRKRRVIIERVEGKVIDVKEGKDRDVY